MGDLGYAKDLEPVAFPQTPSRPQHTLSHPDSTTCPKEADHWSQANLEATKHLNLLMTSALPSLPAALKTQVERILQLSSSMPTIKPPIRNAHDAASTSDTDRASAAGQESGITCAAMGSPPERPSRKEGRTLHSQPVHVNSPSPAAGSPIPAALAAKRARHVLSQSVIAAHDVRPTLPEASTARLRSSLTGGKPYPSLLLPIGTVLKLQRTDGFQGSGIVTGRDIRGVSCRYTITCAGRTTISGFVNADGRHFLTSTGIMWITSIALPRPVEKSSAT